MAWQYAEDGSTSFTLVLGVAPAFDVTVTITLPDGLTGLTAVQSPHNNVYFHRLLGSADTLHTAVDDLIIEGDEPYELQLNNSEDPTYDGLRIFQSRLSTIFPADHRA